MTIATFTQASKLFKLSPGEGEQRPQRRYHRQDYGFRSSSKPASSAEWTSVHARTSTHHCTAICNSTQRRTNSTCDQAPHRQITLNLSPYRARGLIEAVEIAAATKTTLLYFQRSFGRKLTGHRRSLLREKTMVHRPQEPSLTESEREVSSPKKFGRKSQERRSHCATQ